VSKRKIPTTITKVNRDTDRAVMFKPSQSCRLDVYIYIVNIIETWRGFRTPIIIGYDPSPTSLN